MPHRICPTCSNPVPLGERCCPTRNDQRRAQASTQLGRNNRHWRRLRDTAIHRAHGTCSRCGTAESDLDAGSKLTCDLIGGGDHSRATLEQVRVLCRRCHGTSDGARRVVQK